MSADEDPDLDDIVRWRMGRAHDATLLDWRSERAIFEQDIALSRALVGCFETAPGEVRMSAPPAASHLDPWNIERLIRLHGEMASHHPHVAPRLNAGEEQRLAFVAARQDATVFTVIGHRSGLFDGIAVQLSAARPTVAMDTGVIILWPHDFQFRQRQRVPASQVPWTSRRTAVFWRGQLTGLSYDLDGDGEVLLQAMRQPRPLVSDFLFSNMVGDADDFDRWSGTYQRLRAAVLFRARDDIDIGLTEPTDGRGLKLGEYLNRKLGFEACVPRIQTAVYEGRLQNYKLRLALPGNDYASSLKFDLLSDSAVLMPTPPFESYEHYGLQPGRHYIQLAPDLSDLPEKIAWCRDHDDMTRAIAHEGRRHAERLLRLDLELEVQRRILVRIAKSTIS